MNDPTLEAWQACMTEVHQLWGSGEPIDASRWGELMERCRELYNGDQRIRELVEEAMMPKPDVVISCTKSAIS